MKEQILRDLGYDFVSYIGLNLKPRKGRVLSTLESRIQITVADQDEKHSPTAIKRSLDAV